MDTMAVFILICTQTIALPDCSMNNARVVIQGPEVTNAVRCGMVPQAYLAQTEIVISKDEYMKTICRRTSIGKENVG